MKTKMNEMTVANKVMMAIRIIGSVGVIVFASLQLFGVWENAMNLTAPLIGLVLLTQSIQEWKQHRGVAIFGLCAALFIFVCAIIVWFLK